LMADALAAASAIGNEWDRVRALRSLAPHLPPNRKADALGNALVAAKAIRNEEHCFSALELLATYDLPSQSATLLYSLIGLSTRFSRNRMLATISTSMHISAALGGNEALENIHRAITDTAHWYP
jgi:hypothetical protein